LTVFGAVFAHFYPDKRDIWHGGADRGKFHVYRGNVWREKPIFGSLSKRNTGMAALRAGLPLSVKRDSAKDFLSMSNSAMTNMKTNSYL